MKNLLPHCFLLLAPLVSCTTTGLEQGRDNIEIPKADTSSLKAAVLSLPPHAFADCPHEDREKMLRELSEDPLARWDPANDWLHYFSDGGPVRASSMIHLRLYQSVEGDKVAFVHLPKPCADNHPPRLGQTYVLRPTPDGQWKDVTAETLPVSTDMTGHFHPLRRHPVIEYAPFVKEERGDRKGSCFNIGLCERELRWNGRQFDESKVRPRKLTNEW